MEKENSTLAKSSPIRVFSLLAIMSVAQMLQYVLANLMIAKLPGNKFYNGILLGTAECLAMLFSRFLLKRSSDIAAFKIIYGCGACSYLILIAFPSSNLMTYIAVVLMVTCIGGWDNISLLIVELRVPP